MGKSAAGSISETTQVRANARFDQDALARWMTSNVPGFSGPLTVEQVSGGQSNPIRSSGCSLRAMPI